MLSRSRVVSMAKRLVPNRGLAVVVIDAQTSSPKTVNCPNAWIKQLEGGLKKYGGVFTEQDKSVIKIFDVELNPGSEGRQIREGDTIAFGGINFVVTADGGKLRTNRTTWDCVVQQVFN